MTYCVKNYKTKKTLKEDLASGVEIRCYEPGMGSVPENGTVYLEGPHYPEQHRWYAKATIENGRIVKVS